MRALARPWLWLVFATLALVHGPAAAEDSLSGPPPLVSRFVVLLQPAASPQGNDQPLAPEVLQGLSATVGVGLRAGGPHARGGQVVLLPQPVEIGEARRLLGLIRMRPDTVWAELEPGERQTALAARVQAKALATAPVIEVTRLMVTLSDPDTERASRANETLGVEWDDRLSQAAGLRLRVVRPTIGGAWVVELPSPLSLADATEVARRLTGSGTAKHADPATPVAPAVLIPNDPYFLPAPQWSLFDTSTGYYGIWAPEAWSITTGDPNLVVAVVDTGVLPHPDFASRLLPGYDFVSAANSHDGLGRHASGADPGDWHSVADCPGAPAGPSSWHGTHVAGVIAATGNNGVGIAGINWKSRILPVRVLGTCGGDTISILEGMQWAAGMSVPGVPINPNPARVINMSLGGPGACSSQYQAIVDDVLARGSLVVVAAGNDDDYAERYVPASCFGLSTVGSTGPYGDRAPYSNFSFGLDISAPGGDQVNYGTNGGIWSTLDLGTTTPAGYTYRAYQGTSQATPHVSGVASLMLSVNSRLTPANLKALMADNASPFSPSSLCNLAICGAGIVNAYYSVLAAQQYLPPGQLQMPSPVTFPTQQVGAQSAPVTVTITNVGGTSVAISSVVASNLAEFPGTTTCSGTVVAPGGSCQITISFRPAAVGVRSETVTITSGGIGSPQSFTVSGAGTETGGSAYSRNYVQRVYVAYYGRPADPAGLAYWAVRMDAEGGSVNAIIMAFGNSDEFNRRYGGLSHSALVTRIYQQTLGRDPDPAGLAYYVGELQAGRRTLQTITLDVLNGASTAPDSTVVANKLDVAAYYTAKVAAGCPYGSEQDGVNIISNVTASSATVASARAIINDRCGL